MQNPCVCVYIKQVQERENERQYLLLKFTKHIVNKS